MERPQVYHVYLWMFCTVHSAKCDKHTFTACPNGLALVRSSRSMCILLLHFSFTRFPCSLESFLSRGRSFTEAGDCVRRAEIYWQSELFQYWWLSYPHITLILHCICSWAHIHMISRHLLVDRQTHKHPKTKITKYDRADIHVNKYWHRFNGIILLPSLQRYYCT